MYSEFADYCLKTSQYLNKNPVRNFFYAFLSSSPQKRLERTKAKLAHYREQFDREFRIIHAATVKRIEIRQQQLVVPMPDRLSVNTSSSAASVKFPVESGRPTRNFRFIGRSTVLKDVDDALNPTPQSGRGPACCVIHGMAGIGKTQTALEYTYAHGDKYSAIFWLRAETFVELTRSFGMIATKLKLMPVYTPQSSQGSSNDVFAGNAVELAKEWLEQTDKRWLLVFDNVEEAQTIDAFIPRNPSCRGAIIITTQRLVLRQLTETFSRIALGSLDDEAATNLLFKYLERKPRDSSEYDTAFQISKFVGGLPLAIAVMGGYMMVSDSTLTEFLGHLNRSSKVWGAGGKGRYVQDYDHTLDTVFDLAIQELGVNSRRLVNILAFLNPDAIPEEMLVTKHPSEALEFLSNRDEQHIEGEKALKTAKDILSQLNFEDMDPIYGDINGTLGTMLDMIGVTRRAESKRLKQHVIKVRERERASTPSERRTREDEIRLYNAYASAIFYQLDEDAAGVIQTMKECHEHYSLWGTEEEYPFEYAKYYNHTGLAYMHLGDTEKGIWFSKRACELQVAHGGSNAPMSLLYYFVLGNQYYMHGDIRASLDLNERILENRRQVCGATNPATLESYSMTGALLLLDHQAKKAKYVLDSR
ncbi:hypothetical protein SLS63_003753 [Diaporthe eres]|uniref:NB-ARC domain-containing protein n=1 Tax=Diaporthe eres TaxID=83184 RepID=A0ABR1PG51_DIAER